MPIYLSLQDKLHKLYGEGHAQTEEYHQANERLVHQRLSSAQPYVGAVSKGLRELGKYGRQWVIMLGLETRFHFNETPTMDELDGLLDKVPEHVAGY